MLTVEKQDGTTVNYDPRRLRGVNVFTEIEREFATRDRIQFTAGEKNDGQLVLFPAVLFDVTDAGCSSYWRATVSEDGSVTLRPEELHREFFHDDLSEGDPAIRQVFQTMLAKLETEFPALVAQS